MVLKISPRGHWSGKLPHNYTSLQHPVQNVVFSFCTSSEPCYNLDDCRMRIRTIQQIHLHKKKMTDIQYNFIVAGDGWVYEGRGWDHCPVLSHRFELITDSCILIAYLGDLKDAAFKENIWELGYELLEYGYNKKYISPNVQIFEETANYYNEK